MPDLEGPLDAVLHLLDRQVVDWDGRMVCKVDDIELTEYAGGVLAVTGILSGPAALLPRLGGRAGSAVSRGWVELSPQVAGRDIPGRIDFDDVAELSSEVRLHRDRRGSVGRQEPARGDAWHRRLGALTGLPVQGPSGEDYGQVIDARLRRDAGPAGERHLVVTDLVVGPAKPGSHLGYDRRREQGPWLVRQFVRWLHRHSGIVPAREVGVDWDGGRVVCRTHPSALSSVQPDGYGGAHV